MNTCECSDPGCPTHEGANECPNEASVTVRRIDMEDGTTTFDFCDFCATDALSSGVFTDTQDEDGEEEEEPNEQTSEEFSLTIKLDNDAFAEEVERLSEIARILHHAAAKIATGSIDFKLYDINGNTVGSCQIIDA